MLIKVIAVIALAASCLVEEHAYSSQSIPQVKFEKQVVKKVVPVANYIEKDHKHEEHKHVQL
ncbi:hypothetical protein ABMA27_015239 [Loxostege sticticalis]|uniref:Uncharacterized protein n=1 Tax=Loxostege sticticalis TaxID=481309 RepID=A0ABR3I743_LOXSC